MKSNEKKNVLWLSNAPHLATGFSNVARNVLYKLHETGKYEFTIVGINYYGEYVDQSAFPFMMYPAKMDKGDDVLGLNRFMMFLQQDVWDLVFTMYDPFVLENIGPQVKTLQANRKRPFKWIGYYPVDAEQDEGWVKNSVSLTDIPVAYTYYGAEEFLKKDMSIKDKVKVLYHGVDPEVFYPVGEETTKEFRRRYFKDFIDEDTFLITNINRHQIRKDVTRTMMAFKEFKKKVPNSFLYLHMKENDVGGSLLEKARQLDLKPGKDFTIPGVFSEYIGVDESVLNMIYNTSDVITSTTLGEGFGLSSIEAMATKTPVVMPDNSALSEILGEDRGVKVKCGSTLSEFANYGPTDRDRIRPLTNVESLVEGWLWVYEHPEEAKAMTERAYAWAMEHTWDKITDEWVKIFEEAEQQLEGNPVKKGKKK